MFIMQSLTRAGADPTLVDKHGVHVADLAEGIDADSAELPPKGRNPTPAERVAIGLDPVLNCFVLKIPFILGCFIMKYDKLIGAGSEAEECCKEGQGQREKEEKAEE